MSARFAGSRSLDDRRRRRLARTGLEEIASVGGAALVGAATSEGPTPAVRVTHFPLRKLVSPRAWKLWSVSLAVLLASVGLLLGCWTLAPRPEVWGPGVVRLLDPVHGRLPRLFTAACLLLAAQGAVLVYWVRSRSLRDFAGCYRVWLWCAGLMALLGVSVAADLHLAWSQAVCRVWAVRFVHRDVLCWLVPLACPGTVLLGRLLRDVRGCRSSTAMFVVAAVCCLALALWRLGRLPWPPTQHGVALAMSAVLMIAAWATLTAVLLHARFVVHCSAEPPVRRQRVPRAAQAQADPGPKPRRKTKAAASEPAAGAAGTRFRFAPRRWWSQWRRWRAERRAERLARREERKALRQQAQAEKLATRQQAQAEREAAKEQARAERERAAAERQAEKERLAAERQAERERAEADRRQAEAERRAAKEAAKEQAQAETAARKHQPDQPQAKADARAAPAPAPQQPLPTAPADDDSSAEDLPDFDADEPLDPEVLKGLSKSQKRKLRKAHREAQRDRRAA